MNAPLMHEAEVLGRYLIGASPREPEKLRYAAAMSRADAQLSDWNQRVWDVAMRHPALLPPIDGALALTDPLSPIRFRIFTMLAVLEASPAWTTHFLPAERKHWLASLLASGARGALSGAAGLILVAWFRIAWRTSTTSS